MESNNVIIHSVVKHCHENQTPKGDTVEHRSSGGSQTSLYYLNSGGRLQPGALPGAPGERTSSHGHLCLGVHNEWAGRSWRHPRGCPPDHMPCDHHAGQQWDWHRHAHPWNHQHMKTLNQKQPAARLPHILVHTDTRQALGKRHVDVEDLGMDFLTIMGHEFCGPRISALYVGELSELTRLHTILFGGRQEWNFRPGTENTPNDCQPWEGCWAGDPQLCRLWGPRWATSETTWRRPWRLKLIKREFI